MARFLRSSRVIFWLLTKLLFLSAEAYPSHHHASSPKATVLNGTYTGRYLPSFNQDLFLGIPFAQAPRLANPAPLNSTWAGTHDASSYGPQCPGFGSDMTLKIPYSEDCLNINVIRPAGTTENYALPVLFWMYGGGFTQGSNADPMWNLSYIVQTSVQNEQPIVAVSINYRKSFLGFPAGAQAVEAGILNLGFKDQRIALEWVQENIGAFGGNPAKVTIWGESAGAMSVGSQLIAHGGLQGHGLFRQGMLESTSPGDQFYGTSPASATLQAGYDAVVGNASCAGVADTMACLRAAPLEALYPGVFNQTGWGPMIDGDFIRRSPTMELVSGSFQKVPILLGCNSDEGLIQAQPLNTSAQFDVWLDSNFPNAYNSTLEEMKVLYPNTDAGQPMEPFSVPTNYDFCGAMAAAGVTCGPYYRRTATVQGDNFAHAGRRYMNQIWASNNLTSYSFLFDTDPTYLPIVNFPGLGPGFATHGSELTYAFGQTANFTGVPGEHYPAVAPIESFIQVSHAMVSKWVSFVYAGDPNAVNLDYVPEWPVYTGQGQNMVFNASRQAGLNIHVADDDYRQEQIAFLNSHRQELNGGGA